MWQHIGMPQFASHREIAPNVYRERIGIDFEDFEPGMVFQHRPGRTIYQTDNARHTLESLNGAMLHFDEEYARHTEWERPLVVSTYTLEVVTGMTTRTFGRVAANLGWDKVTLPHPVFHGDTLYAASTILSKRDSKSRPAQGILRIATEGANQDGKVVIRFERTILMYKRGHGPYEAAGY